MDIMLAAEWIFFGCSLAVFSKKNDKKIWLLFVIAFVTVLVESIGFYYRVVLETSNHHLYNISIPVIILLFQFLFLYNLKRVKNRQFVKLSIAAVFIFTLINLIYFQAFTRLATYTYIFGAVFLVIDASLYFLELVKRPVIVSLKGESMFYIACAVILLYLPKTILYSVFEYLAYKDLWKKEFGQVFTSTNLFLSLIFFLLLSYACLCRLIYRNSSLDS